MDGQGELWDAWMGAAAGVAEAEASVGDSVGARTGGGVAMAGWTQGSRMLG